MPQRTNAFQTIVALVQKALAPVSAKVTESAMVKLADGGEAREIDILIETAVGLYEIKIAVEAKDLGRKMDATVFESVIGKYLVEGGVKVNKLVIVTHRGFTAPVIDRARKLGVELLTFEQAVNADWFKIYPQAMNFQMMPHLDDIHIEPQLSPADLQKIMKEGCVYCSHRTAHGNLQQFMNAQITNAIQVTRPNLLREMYERAVNGDGHAREQLIYKPNHEHFIRCLDGETFPLTKLSFKLHYVNDKGKMEYTLCRMDSQTGGESKEVPVGQVVVGGKKITMVMPEGMKSQKITMRVDSAETKPTQKAHADPDPGEALKSGGDNARPDASPEG